jgi:hypothetical protein
MAVDVFKGLVNQRCMEKDEVKFECVFNKEVKPEEVRWFKDGIKLTDNEDDGRIQFINEGKTQSLLITSAKVSDIGTYEIKVRDVNSSATLKVKGK